MITEPDAFHSRAWRVATPINPVLAVPHRHLAMWPETGIFASAALLTVEPLCGGATDLKWCCGNGAARVIAPVQGTQNGQEQTWLIE
ncbi:MAG: hypothetical protein ACOX61_12630 [Brooklawnia sp.]|jgi:hypothetical protein